MTKPRRDNGLLITAHALVILLAFSSPWWLDWRLVLAGVAAYYVQLLVFKGCVLSQYQFKNSAQTFHGWYLAKLGWHPDPVKLLFVLNYVLPPLILVIAFAWQLWLHRVPLVVL